VGLNACPKVQWPLAGESELSALDLYVILHQKLENQNFLTKIRDKMRLKFALIIFLFSATYIIKFYKNLENGTFIF